MTREDAATKARRLLAEGRVTLRVLSEDQIVAVIRGDSARLYTASWEPSGWRCDCDARSRCSHLMALMLVVLEPRMVKAVDDVHGRQVGVA